MLLFFYFDLNLFKITNYFVVLGYILQDDALLFETILSGNPVYWHLK